MRARIISELIQIIEGWSVKNELDQQKKIHSASVIDSEIIRIRPINAPGLSTLSKQDHSFQCYVFIEETFDATRLSREPLWPSQFSDSPMGRDGSSDDQLKKCHRALSHILFQVFLDNENGPAINISSPILSSAQASSRSAAPASAVIPFVKVNCLARPLRLHEIISRLCCE